MRARGRSIAAARAAKRRREGRALDERQAAMSGPVTVRVDPAGERVKCATCGDEYVCAPGRDYYNATTLTDGVCEPCLLANAGIKGPVRVIAPGDV